MDKPRLRPTLEAFPLATKQGRMLALRDPLGLTDAMALLPPVALCVVQLFDGVRDRREIQAEFLRRHGQLLPTELYDRLVADLDGALLLDSDRFRAHVAEVRSRWSAEPVRPAAHAGKAYPDQPAELRAFLQEHFGAPDGVAAPRALIAPHIDLHRGARAYGLTYPALARSDADLFIIFGTDHVGADHPFTLTRKHYDTPLGRVETDQSLCDALVSRLGTPATESLFADELHHRNEHSIEFQALLLRFVLPAQRPITILPVLCGSLHRLLETTDDPAARPEIGRFLHTLAELTEGRKVCVIAGADLAHVGPRFGDPHPLGPAQRQRLAEADAKSLAACAAGDARAFWDTIRADGDARRVCGTAPIYHTLTLARARAGAVVAYEQCPAESGSVVSVGGVVLR